MRRNLLNAFMTKGDSGALHAILLSLLLAMVFLMVTACSFGPTFYVCPYSHKIKYNQKVKVVGESFYAGQVGIVKEQVPRYSDSNEKCKGSPVYGVKLDDMNTFFEETELEVIK